MHPVAVRISRKQTSARTYDCITLVIGDMHFHKDITSDRDIRLAKALAEFHCATFMYTDELAERVNSALQNYKGISATLSDSSEEEMYAKRYRFLRENWVEFHPQPTPEAFSDAARLRRGALDAAIDSKMLS